MFGPFLELIVNAVDTAATVVVLLALWDGRSARGGRLLRWLGGQAAGTESDVEGFLRKARSAGCEEPAGADGTTARPGSGSAGAGETAGVAP